MAESISLAGKFLLSLPGMEDPRFARSVIALCLHDGDGAFGIDLARADRSIDIGHIFSQLLEAGSVSTEGDVLTGGPVEPQRGFVLHSLDYLTQDSVSVDSRWGLSASRTIIHDIANGAGPRTWLFALGYSGWAANQLEGELTRNGWLIAALDFAEIAAIAPENRWEWAYRSMGIAPASLGTAFGSS